MGRMDTQRDRNRYHVSVVWDWLLTGFFVSQAVFLIYEISFGKKTRHDDDP